MKSSILLSVIQLFTLSVYAVPSTNEISERTICTSPVKLSGNPFSDRILHANSHYGDYVAIAANTISDPVLKAQAIKVGKVGTFLWLNTNSTILALDSYLKKVNCDEIIGLVINDLPGVKCGGKRINGRPPSTVEQYKADYINRWLHVSSYTIAKIIQANSNVAIAIIIEPELLTNIVLNAVLSTCQNARPGYEEGVAYALSSLNLPNVVQYIDAGHGGGLGWDENLKSGAEAFAKVYKAAGSPDNVRGIATNVAGWNAWSMSPGEFEPADDSKYNMCQDEKRYVQKFGASLKTAGFPNHAIVDTSRNAVQGLRLEWVDWCNVNGAGFGVRPTADTGETLADAFVWVKPGGESDGTTDTFDVQYDSYCGKLGSFKPSPQAGQWNQAYFEMLLKNAKPQF